MSDLNEPIPEISPNRSCGTGEKRLRLRPLSPPLFDSQPPYQNPPRLRFAIRAARGVWGTILVLVLFAAAHLEPDPTGLGTHEQWGLPPCTMRQILGVPCPSCGMTTSFAHFVRGQFWQAAQANTAGLLLAACCVVQIPWSYYIALTGRSRSVYTPAEILLWILLIVTLTALIQWGIRMLI